CPTFRSRCATRSWTMKAEVGEISGGQRRIAGWRCSAPLPANGGFGINCHHTWIAKRSSSTQAGTTQRARAQASRLAWSACTPQGSRTGPQPGAAEAAIASEAGTTAELAVMIDTFRPLLIGSQATPVRWRDCQARLRPWAGPGQRHALAM